MKVRLEHVRCEADPEPHVCVVDLPTVPRVNEWLEVRDGDRVVAGTVRAVLWGFEAHDGEAVASEPVIRYR